MDKALGDFEEADILIEGKKIVAVRPNIEAPGAQLVDCYRNIVMPGFVDTHRHMWQGFLRNVLPDGSLMDYIQLVQRKFGANFAPEDVYAAELLSGLGCIDAGVTTVLDWSHIHNSPEHTDAAIKGLQESGVRAVFAYGNPQTASGNWKEAPRHKSPGDIARLRKQYFNSDDQLLTLAMASPGGTPDEVLAVWKQARDVGARITIHVGVGEFGRNALIERINATEPLRSDTTYVHCCTLNDMEWKLIKDSGGAVSIAGYVEKLMGHGNPPVQKAIDAGTVTQGPWSPPMASTAIVNLRDIMSGAALQFRLRKYGNRLFFGRRFWLAGDDLAATVITVGTDVMTTMGFTGSRLN